MDNPIRQIRPVVEALCTGTREEQEKALRENYTTDASFVHPFCRVPHFNNGDIPFLSWLNSRFLLLSIYRWYRILSPKIEMKIYSTVLDEKTNQLYVQASQIFRIWFIPFYKADVKLVVVLSLAPHTTGANGSLVPCTITDDSSAVKNGEDDNSTSQAGEVSFADVVKYNTTDEDKIPNKGSTAPSESETGSGPVVQRGDSGIRYLISQQEDMYQVNEFIKFVVPFGVGDSLWTMWQLISTSICVALAIVFLPFAKLFDKQKRP